MTALWQAGQTYVPGSLVVPTSTPPPANTQPANPSFETGTLSGWSTVDPAKWAISTGGAYSGTYSVKASGGGTTNLLSDTHLSIPPGGLLSASVHIALTNVGTDDLGALIGINWYDASNVQIGTTVKGTVIYGKGGFWTASSVSANAPAGASYARLVLVADTGSHGGNINFDAVTVTSSVKTVPPGLVYKATQAAPGKSAATEPTWPGDTTTPVTDNQVTWQGVIASQIVWQASPILKSGATEPVWPTDATALVPDGNGQWTTTTPAIADPKCPHSIQVLIASDKVLAGDDDITRYSATDNPLDWSTINDAGFIAHGLRSVQETSVTALALYRGNIAIFTASCLQLWKADPDPAAIVILDAVESIGTSYARGTIPVSQDVFFISPLGVRSVSVSASQQAMGEGDIGQPMDPIVQSLLGPTVTPLCGFFPNLGQTLFFFGNQVVVLFTNKLTKLTGWALYQLPITVTDVATLDGDLYLRDATDIYWFKAGAKSDYGTSFPVVLEWQYLDFGTPGTVKNFTGLTMDADTSAAVSAGYDVQTATRRTGTKRIAQATEAFLSFAFVGKQAAFRLEMDSATMTSFTRMNVYFEDGGML